MNESLKIASALAVLLLGACAIGPMRVNREVAEIPAEPAPSEARAEEVGAEYMDVLFERDQVLSIVRDPGAEAEAAFPDLVTMKGRNEPERCLVLQATPESVLIRLPRVPPAAASAEPAPDEVPRGSGTLSGRVVRKRRSVSGCQVRLTLLRSESYLWVFSKISSGDLVLKTSTDRSGRFRFDQLPPGPYRLAFRPKGSSHWLIRLREVPVDAELPPGGVVDVGKIDLGKRRLD